MDIKKIAHLKEPPFLKSHSAVWSLLQNNSIYDIDDHMEDLFFKAMKENTIWHFNNNSSYRAFCRSRGFSPENDLTTPDDLNRIPPIFVDIFKENELSTLNEPKMMRVTSSGTSGKKTTISLDIETVMRMWAMARAAFLEDGLISKEPVNYIIFAPDPSSSATLGNAHFFTSITEFAPGEKYIYALKAENGGELKLDIRSVLRALDDFSSESLPVRIIGLPALIAKVAKESLSRRVTLPCDSLVFTGGGWKNASYEKMPKIKFRELLADAWGIFHKNIRDLYGMTEHAVHYLECSNHNFHEPLYSRVEIVDPITEMPVKKGEKGAIKLINPGFTTMPAQSILTADIGTYAGECGCSRNTKAFNVIGRGKKNGYRGCAATTLERVTI